MKHKLMATQDIIKFMRMLLILICLIIYAVTPLAAQDRPLPNILILYADDFGYGDLAIQNANSKIPTPNLDQLAKEGLRFTDGHSSSGICTPSRYALLTGRYHWRKFHGIVGPFGASKFHADRLTLPEMLKSQGYTTACIGKWHLGWNWEAIKKPNAKQVQWKNRKVWGPEAFDWSLSIPDGPLDHGFEYYFGDTVINFPPYCWIENDKVVVAPDTIMDVSQWKKIKEGNWECRPGPMISGWDPYAVLPTLTQKGVEYIHNRKDQSNPFFLYFAFPSPHAPIIPNDDFDQSSAAGAYGDFIVETDDACGQLLAALEQSGQAANTIVIFTSDNGPEQYAYARDKNHEHWSAEPLRGLKRDIYEGGHRVPFLVRWPNIIKASSVSNALVSQIDFMATIAAIVGSELPKSAAEDSYDMTPLLRGKEAAIRTSLVHNTRKNEYAIRNDHWLLIAGKTGYVTKRNAAWEQRRGLPTDDDQPVELYDLNKDLGQRVNLASEFPEVVDHLQQLLEQIREQGHSAPRLRSR